MKRFLQFAFVLILIFSFKNVAVAQDYWKHYDVPYNSFLISQADSKHIVISGLNDGIFKSLDSGESWINIHPIDITSQDYFIIRDIVFPNPNLIIAIADSMRYIPNTHGKFYPTSAHILRSDNGGITWSRKSFGAIGDTNSRSFTQIIMNDNDNGVIVQQWQDTNRTDRLPPLLITSDGGITWIEVSKPDINFSPSKAGLPQFPQFVSSPLPGVWFIHGRDYSKQKNIIWATKDFGANWATIEPPIKVIQKIQFLDSLNGFAIGYEEFRKVAIFARTVDGGKNWLRKEFLADDFGLRKWGISFNDLDFFDKNNGMIAESYSILTTSDGGTTWKTEYPGLVDSTGWQGYWLGRIKYIDQAHAFGLGDKFLKYIPNGIIEQPKLTTPRIVELLGGRLDTLSVPGKIWWYSVPKAEKYYVQIVKGENGFSNPNAEYVLNDSTITNSIYVSNLFYKVGLPNNEYNYTVRVRAASFDSLSNWSFPVSFRIVKSVTSIENSSSLVELPYPNPASNIIYIPFKTTNESEIHVSITDAVGRSFNTFKSSYSQSQNAIILSELEQLPNGIYFVQITQGNHSQTSMITIAK